MTPIARIRQRLRKPEALRPDGWPPGPPSPVDALSDEELEVVNSMLPWQCFTADGRGRRFGDRAWAGKREAPQEIPDRRIELMDERFGLAGSAVLELGCFEGVHTVGLCSFGAEVTALDARAENVVKTLVRAGLYGFSPTVLRRDLEDRAALEGLQGRVAHHVGVLYHLHDPVRHLIDLGEVVSGVMLDTHVTHEPTDEYEVEGRAFEFSTYTEGGRADVFSGMRPTARWLSTESLTCALELGGFSEVEVVEARDERNGPRLLLFASR